MIRHTAPNDQPDWVPIQQRDWDEMAAMDPYWAVLSDPAKRHGGWDVEAFFRTGHLEIDRLLEEGLSLGLPHERGSALDFGSGMGRLTQALAAHFASVTGVDISPVMIDQARHLAVGMDNCSFVLNDADTLLGFDDRRFDLVYSNVVLQHLADRRAVEGYLVEFVRVLRPGGLLVFQLPDQLPLRRRLQLRPRLYALLRRLRISAKFAYSLGLHPIRMRGLPESLVVELMTMSGARVVRVASGRLPGTKIVNHVYYVTK